MQSDTKSYPLDRLPPIDYDAHPAYGRVLPMPMPGPRLKALSYFGYGLLLATAQRLIDIDHLPAPADGGNRFVAILRALPATLRLIALQRLGRIAAGAAFAPKTERGAAVLTPLQRDGFVALRLGADQIGEMRRLLAAHLATLDRKVVSPDDPDSTSLAVDPITAPDIYKWCNQIAADLGLSEAASAYLKRPVRVGRIAAQVIDASATPSPFADVGVEASPCDGYGIDLAANVLKLVIYLGDVGSAGGPLSYVAGSQRAARIGDALIRRANDLCGLSSTLPQWRETFYALPAGLQRKASFGADIVAGDTNAAAIEANQVTVTSDIGNAVLYDPSGIHRDGVVTQGRRQAAVLTFTELAR